MRQKKKDGLDEQDNAKKGAASAYCSWFWFGGFLLSASSVTIHLSVLPYADLTLLSTNSIVGILFAQILSVMFLGEKWIAKYDLGALFFIISGCATIVLISDKEEIKFDAESIKEMLFNFTTISYLATCCFIVLFDYLLI